MARLAGGIEHIEAAQRCLSARRRPTSFGKRNRCCWISPELTDTFL